MFVGYTSIWCYKFFGGFVMSIRSLVAWLNSIRLWKVWAVFAGLCGLVFSARFLSDDTVHIPLFQFVFLVSVILLLAVLYVVLMRTCQELNVWLNLHPEITVMSAVLMVLYGGYSLYSDPLSAQRFWNEDKWFILLMLGLPVLFVVAVFCRSIWASLQKKKS